MGYWRLCRNETRNELGTGWNGYGIDRIGLNEYCGFNEKERNVQTANVYEMDNLTGTSMSMIY